jgi:hypothetical protein
MMGSDLADRSAAVKVYQMAAEKESDLGVQTAAMTDILQVDLMASCLDNVRAA